MSNDRMAETTSRQKLRYKLNLSKFIYDICKTVAVGFLVGFVLKKVFPVASIPSDVDNWMIGLTFLFAFGAFLVLKDISDLEESLSL
jgi:uncharacterized membrane protein (Fun14 family)